MNKKQLSKNILDNVNKTLNESFWSDLIGTSKSADAGVVSYIKSLFLILQKELEKNNDSRAEVCSPRNIKYNKDKKCVYWAGDEFNYEMGFIGKINLKNNSIILDKVPNQLSPKEIKDALERFNKSSIGKALAYNQQEVEKAAKLAQESLKRFQNNPEIKYRDFAEDHGGFETMKKGLGSSKYYYSLRANNKSYYFANRQTAEEAAKAFGLPTDNVRATEVEHRQAANENKNNIYMNKKKQLQESIMAGVKKAFKENKSLNEGFSAWSEQNVPRVDYNKVNDAINSLSPLFGKLCDLKQLIGVQLIFHDEKSASWKSIDKLDVVATSTVKNDDNDNRKFAEIIKTLLNSGIVNFKKIYCKDDEDKFVAAINELYIKIIMSKQSHLYKYIISTIDPGSNKIKNMPYITLVKVDDNNVALRFSLQTLLDECPEILDYFS